MTEAAKLPDASVLGPVQEAIEAVRARPRLEGVGRVRSLGQGIAIVEGLPGVETEEAVIFDNRTRGLVLDMDPSGIGVVLLGPESGLGAGSEVKGTGQRLAVPVGPGLLGRVVDPLGNPLDGRGAIQADEHREPERDAPAIIDRSPVTEPLMTGLKVVDSLFPIGRGQRELIVGDRQTGKTAVALDAIINQRGRDVACFYCGIGKRASALAKVVEELAGRQALGYTCLVITEGDDPPGLQYLAPYAATAMAEYHLERGGDALIVYDDLTLHARAYREIALLLRRPPGREAYPGDIFYIHARLLERATHLNDDLGGGSLTALPIVETQAQNISAYIPTNLISITDGQIYLSPNLFQKGVMPAVEVGKSVSRVGGKAQLPAYRAVAGDLKLSYSQFEELESFARFGARLDEQTRQTLDHGRRIREVFKQPQSRPLGAAEQVAVLLAAVEGELDDLPLDKVDEAEGLIRGAVAGELNETAGRIEKGDELDDDARQNIVRAIGRTLDDLKPEKEQGGAKGDGKAGRDAES